jgi:hypothetical protein
VILAHGHCGLQAEMRKRQGDANGLILFPWFHQSSFYGFLIVVIMVCLYSGVCDTLVI